METVSENFVGDPKWGKFYKTKTCVRKDAYIQRMDIIQDIFYFAFVPVQQKQQ